MNVPVILLISYILRLVQKLYFHNEKPSIFNDFKISLAQNMKVTYS